MESNLRFYLNDIEKNEFGASDLIIKDLKSQLDFELSKDYIDLMKEFNGGEGEVGENSWLCLFPLEDLIRVNKDYSSFLDQVPDYFLFGKDAADTGYAFHKQRHTVHSFGLMSDFETDSIEYCGNTFVSFVEYLYNQQ